MSPFHLEHTPCEFQQRFNPRVVDDDPLLQHQRRIEDDVLHPKLQHVCGRKKNMDVNQLSFTSLINSNWTPKRAFQLKSLENES